MTSAATFQDCLRTANGPANICYRTQQPEPITALGPAKPRPHQYSRDNLSAVHEEADGDADGDQDADDDPGDGST